MRVNGINVPVHRHIMEQIIGRPLLPSEVVHHINGDKHDNRPENLMILPVSDHSRLTNVGRKWPEEVKAKVSASLIGNQRRKGIPHTAETLRLLHEQRLGNQNAKGHRPSNPFIKGQPSHNKGKKLGPDGHYH
jgi:hypothetical protein